MEIDHLLKTLIQNEEDKLKKYVLFMLHKFSHLIEFSTDEGEYLPLLLIKNNKITFVYKDEEIDDSRYIFSDYEEILIILQKQFNEDKKIYLIYTEPVIELSKNEIMEKINEALEKNDKEKFDVYSLKLKRGE